MSQPTMRKYPAEFKERAVKLAVESDQPIAQTARDLGVNENTLHTWIGKYHTPPDLVVNVKSLIMQRLFSHGSGYGTSSKHHTGTGKGGVSHFHYWRPNGPPLNPVESENCWRISLARVG